MLVQGLELGLIAAQRQLHVPLEARADGGGADGRIAVHVTADPRREAHRHAPLAQLDAVDVPDRSLEILRDGGRHPVEHLGQEEEHLLHLVRHGGPARQLLLRLPTRRELESDPLHVRGDVLGRPVRHREAVHQQPREALVLPQQSPANRLGRVSREDRLDPDPAERPGDLVHAVPFVLERLERSAQATRLVPPLPAVGDAPPEPVHLLRHVDRAEVRGEGAHELQRALRGEPLESPREVGLGARITLSSSARRESRPLDRLEESFPLEVTEEVPEERPDESDVTTERAVLGLEARRTVGGCGHGCRRWRARGRRTSGRRGAPASTVQRTALSS